MDTRRFRDRVFGWAMLMMFVLVQTAAGASNSTGELESSALQDGNDFSATADFNPETHQVTVKANVPVVAWDAAASLGRRSFVVYEDEVRRPIESIEVAHTPLSIGVLLENGGRYRALNEAIADTVSHAARDLMNAVNPGDRVALWTYGQSVQSLDSSVENGAAVQLINLRLPVPPTSEANLYDAVLATLPRVQQMPGRKVLIVVSTGIDTFSRSGFAEVLRAERETGVPVCAINIGPLVRSGLLVDGSDGQQPYAHLRWQQAASQLARMAEVSGCRAVMPDSSLEFSTLYDELLANLNLQYVIRYQSATPQQSGTHRVEIAWVDSEHPRAGLRQAMKRGRLFAQAQYQPAPAAAEPHTLASSSAVPDECDSLPAPSCRFMRHEYH